MKKRSNLRTAKTRNPMAAAARRMKTKIEAPAKAYRRRPKHKKKPDAGNGDGG